MTHLHSLARSAKTLLLGLAFLAGSETAAGQTLGCDDAPVTGDPLTLALAVETALCRNARTASAWAAMRMQAAQVDLAKAAYWPGASGSITAQSNVTQASSPPGTSRVHGYSSHLAVSWRALDGGERAAQAAAAEQMMLAATSTRDDAVRKVLAETARAYFGAIQTQVMSRARSMAISRAEATLAAARSRELRGVTSRSDTLQSQTLLARARLAQHQAKAEHDKAVASLVRVLGLPSDTRILLPERLLVSSEQPLPELPDLLLQARQQHPAILAARAQREASRSQVRLAGAQGRPTVDLSLSHTQNGYPNQNLQTTRSGTLAAGITINIPLFDGFSRQHKVAYAKAQADQSAIAALDTEQQILGELIKAHADALAALDSLQVSAQWLDAATASLASATHRYERGAAEILELLTAQNSHADALEARAVSESQWNIAGLNLLIDAGALDRGWRPSIQAVPHDDAPPQPPH